MAADARGWDETVIVNGHVDESLLTAAEVADLEANFPIQGGVTAWQRQVWLDGAYLQRHTSAVGFIAEQS